MKVFLSSTYVDLVEHRKAAHDALERLGQEVGRMEIFGARDGEATTVALDQLKKSDLVVGIYAHRYGFIPDGADVSITEQEYIHAKNEGKPILCFVVEEEHPWSPKMIEKDAGKIKKLEDFRAKILKENVVDFFTTPADLGMKVATSVHNCLEELKAQEEAARQSELSINVGGDFNGILTFGNQNAVSNAQAWMPDHRPATNTLPTQPFFFGRVEELKTIAAALAPESRTWGALIDGPGGIGKTALAIKAAHDAAPELFERKIFITAKVRELTPEGEKPLKDFSRDNYFSMLNELALELGEDGIPRLAPDERADPLRRAMAGQKILIVFDNLETLPEDERARLFQFLSYLPAGNKAIVTSRRRADVDARIIRLDRLLRDEAMQLLDELAGRYPRLARASQKERDELYEITQGNPLFMRWIVGQLGRAGSQCRSIAEACAFIEKTPKGNDPLEYIFGDLLETFTASETKVLAALTHFTQPAKLAWIAQMTELPERQAETALEDLADRSILISNIESRTFFLPPLTAQFIKTRRPEVVSQTGDALTQRAYALVMQYGGDTNYEGFKTLDTEWELLAAALPRFLQGENYHLQTVCDQLMVFLNFTGRWDERLWLCEQAESRALAAKNKERAGRRAYEAGWVYALRNQPDLVLTCAARVAAHWMNSPPRLKSIAIGLRGKGYELKKDYPPAISAYREAVDINRTISPESDDVAVGLNDLAGAEHHNENYLAAERNYYEALRIAKIIKDDEGTTIYIGNLAALALDLKQWAKAESLAREALALAEKVGRQELIASDCDRIAQALLKQNQVTDEALSLSRRAVEIFTRLRMQDNLQDAQETLAQIEQACGEE